MGRGIKMNEAMSERSDLLDRCAVIIFPSLIPRNLLNGT